MTADGGFNISAAKYALEGLSLSHPSAGGGVGDEEVHGMKAGGELGYGVVVGPALEWGMRVVRYGRGRCWRGQEVMWKAVDARCVV